jgi:carbon-monoxide dehydrogenase medium subunit
MRSGRLRPELIVDIKHIKGSLDISEQADGWHIGAAASGASIGDNAKLCAEWPGCAEAVQLIGSTQVQGRASFAGNLCNASPAGDSVPALVAAGAKAVIAGKNGTRSIPVEEVPAGPNLSFPNGKARRLTPICASFRAPKWTSPSSARVFA